MQVLDLEVACSTLCTNRDCSLVAVAGRKVFKIIRISADKLSVYLDLRDLPPKSLNLNYGCQDVQWNPKEDHVLASAPNTGSIVLWDLNSKAAKNKISYVFKDIHTRAVNKICFHPREVNLLISGSQDSTMLTIDIRTHIPVQKFRGVDSVRDVKVCPHPYPRDMLFAVCYDNGTVQIWDRRQQDSPIKSFQMHTGPAYSCSWHPDNDIWLASAGRDKSIKILELQANVSRPKEVYSIYTMSSVARVKWRPNHKHHITSCSHLLDTVVAVWDIRRSYIPLASFMSHSDDVTDFAWLNDVSIASCSKDGKLIYEGIHNTVKPADKATPVGLSINTDNSLAHACGDYVSHRSHATASLNNHIPYPTGGWRPFPFRKQAEGGMDPLTSSQPAFLDVNSTLKEYTHNSGQFKIDCFVAMAISYKLRGASPHETCDHNFKVAQKLGKMDVAQTWRMLSLLYCEKQADLQHLGFLPPLSGGMQSQLSYRVSSANSVSSDVPQFSKDGVADAGRPVVVKETVTSAGGSVADDEGTESSDGGDNADEILDFHDDFDEFIDRDSDVAAASSTSHNITEWELPAEPFLPRQKLRPDSPDLVSAESASQSAQGSTEAGRTSRLLDAYSHHHQQQQAIWFPCWNFRQIVANMLSFYAEKGDVQTSVSAMLVLQDTHLQKLINSQLIQLWFSSYIDLLKRKQLWKEAALVIKLCPWEEISSESQNSTAMINNCGYCKKSLPNSGWTCERCEKLTNHCSVCHGTVQGLYTSCQMCGHGGHLDHMIEWHKKSNTCPSGCGHTCIT